MTARRKKVAERFNRPNNRPSRGGFADTLNLCGRRGLRALICCAVVLAGPAFAAGGQADGAGSHPVKLMGHGGPIMAVAIDPDRAQVLTGSFDYSVIVRDLNGAEGAIRHRLIGHEAAVNDVAFVPGSARAVSVSDDGSLAVWDLGSGSLIKRFTDTPDKVLDVAVSDDGRLAAVARWDGTARIFDLNEMVEVGRFQGHDGNVNAVAFSADAKTLYTASYDGSIRSWDTATGAERAVIFSHGWGINVLERVGDTLVFGGLDGTLAKFDIASGESLELTKGERPVLALAQSADRTRIAAGSGDGRITVFQTRDWTLLEDYDSAYGPVWGLAFTDRQGASLYHSGLDDFAILWQVSPRKAFDQPEGVYPRRFQFSEDMSSGERQFQRKCSICHTLEEDGGNRAGPTLYKVFGRRAGTLPGYPYSQGLRDANIVWNERTIAQLFDEGPDILTPGSKMPLQRLKNIEDRDALIAFLKSATEPDKQVKGDTGQ